jgi:hypothetical protein
MIEPQRPPPEPAQFSREVVCPKCGEPNAETSRYCRACGHDLKGMSSTAVALLMAFVGFPALCLGGCFVYGGVQAFFAPVSSNFGGSLFGFLFLVLGLGGLTTFGLILYYAFLKRDE